MSLSPPEQEAVTFYSSTLRIFSDDLLVMAWISLVKCFVPGRPRYYIAGSGTNVCYQDILQSSRI